MAKSLADLRATPRTKHNERTMTVCLAHDLVAEVQALTEELQDLDLQAVREAGEELAEEARRTRKAAETDAEVAERTEGRPTESPRAAEVRERLAALLDEMAEYEGELRLRATRTDGEWRRWVNEHPAREEKQPGHARDVEVALGYCNADDLIDDLAIYAHSWNGEPLVPGDWDKLGVSAPDKKQAARTVVAMYEAAIDLPKWQRAFSANLRSEGALRSRGLSESAPAASTGGSPRSDMSTTTPTGT